MEHETIRRIVSLVLAKINESCLSSVHPKPFPIGVSNRHIHLSQHDVELLFGAGHCIQCERDLSQPGQCAAFETVIIAGPKGCIEQVRVLGPARKQTQVEISRSDSFRLGINPPTRESGKLEGSSGLTVIGPRGSIQLPEGAIVAKRHIHMSPFDAQEYGVADGQTVQVKVDGERGVIFDNVAIRVSDKFVLEFHVDIDEANAAGIKQGGCAHLVTAGGSVPMKQDNLSLQAEANLSNAGSSVINITGNKAVEEPKVLVTEEIVRKAREKRAVLVINKGVICTPLAKDAIKELGAEVIWK